MLATGGLSIPKMGATGFSYDVARQFGLRVTRNAAGARAASRPAPTSPASTRPSPVSLWKRSRRVEKQSFRENILFTHRGLSGPAILQISSYWRPGGTISIDMLPDLDATAFLVERKRARPKASPQTVLAEILPARLAQVADGRAPACRQTWPTSRDRALAAFAGRLKRWEFRPTGTEGYAKAEVTLGGIDTRDLSSKTMAARNVHGLYAIGEAVDVTGWLGGYNFQWAWSSGWAAGQSL